MGEILRDLAAILILAGVFEGYAYTSVRSPSPAFLMWWEEEPQSPFFTPGRREALGTNLWTALDYIIGHNIGSEELPACASDLMKPFLDLYTHTRVAKELGEEGTPQEVASIATMAQTVFQNVSGDDAACIRRVAKSISDEYGSKNVS